MKTFTTRPATPNEAAYGMTAVSEQTVTIDATLRPWARGRVYRVEFWGDGVLLPNVVQLSARPVDDDSTPECLGDILPHDEVVTVDGVVYLTTAGRKPGAYPKLRRVDDPEKAAAGTSNTAAAIRAALDEIAAAAAAAELPYWTAAERAGAVVHDAGNDGFTVDPCRRSMRTGVRLTAAEVEAIAGATWCRRCVPARDRRRSKAGS